MGNDIKREFRGPRVNVNADALDEARGIFEQSTHKTFRRRQFSGLTGEQAMRDAVRGRYRDRIQRELAVPRRGQSARAVPMLDGLFELDNGEFVVAEGKAGASRMGETRAGMQFTPEWFDARLSEIAEKDELLANRLRQAWREGKITALSVHVPRHEFHVPKGGKNIKVSLVDVENYHVDDWTKRWNDHLGVESQAKPPIDYRYSPGGTGQIDDAARGISSANQALANPLEGASALAREKGISGAFKATSAGFKARSLVIGVKAWKVVRTVGKFAVLVFVPLKVLDVVIEVALALWDREREKEERKRREKQKALEAVFKLENSIPLPQARYDRELKEETKVQSLIQSKILKNAPLFEEFVRAWDSNKKYQGFLYARLWAELHIETFRDFAGNESEALTTYRVATLDVSPTNSDVSPTNSHHDFELTEIGAEKELDKTESDFKRLFGQGIMYPSVVRKFVQKKRLKYTIVPPLFTPFDIVVTKINNLFLDIVLFVTAFSGAGDPDSFTGFNYKGTYDEQFTVTLEFPNPLNESTCRYCLSYLHWAAGMLSQHPLTEQDLEGNLEDPRKGWKRRFWLLMKLLEKQYAPQGKNFPVLAGRVKELVKGGGKSEEVISALDELYTGARAIWYDLERIKANIHKPQYYYLGPTYKEPA